MKLNAAQRRGDACARCGAKTEPLIDVRAPDVLLKELHATRILTCRDSLACRMRRREAAEAERQPA